MTATPAPRAPRTAAWKSRFSAPTRVTPSRSRRRSRSRRNRQTSAVSTTAAIASPAAQCRRSASGGFLSGTRPFFMRATVLRNAGTGAQRPPPDVKTQEAGGHFQQRSRHRSRLWEKCRSCSPMIAPVSCRPNPPLSSIRRRSGRRAASQQRPEDQVQNHRADVQVAADQGHLRFKCAAVVDQRRTRPGSEHRGQNQPMALDRTFAWNAGQPRR